MTGYGMNSELPSQEKIVSWGKHKGEKMGSVPTEYLEWFHMNAYRQMKARKAWVQEELDRRKLLENPNAKP